MFKGDFVENEPGFTLKDIIDLACECGKKTEDPDDTVALDVAVGEVDIIDFMYALIDKNHELRNRCDELETRCLYYDDADSLRESIVVNLEDKIMELESKIENLISEHEQDIMEREQEWSEALDEEHDRYSRRELQINTLLIDVANFLEGSS
jgi:vacuolar-type H+-ATPase subunit I/STV1